MKQTFEEWLIEVTKLAQAHDGLMDSMQREDWYELYSVGESPNDAINTTLRQD